MRWVVGDVHGCALELEDLLGEIRFDPARDELWSIGDLVNKGRDSLAALRLWRDARGRAVIGNHDVYALRAASGAIARKRDDDTLDAVFRAPDGADLLRRLRDQPILAHLPGGDGFAEAWLVHAGIDPRWTDLHAVALRQGRAAHDDMWLESDDVRVATRLRCCTATGERSDHSGPPAGCPPPYRPWDTFWTGPQLVVHGHWAARGLYRGEHTLGLDSGCVYGGALAAWCQEEDRIVEVPARSRG